MFLNMIDLMPAPFAWVAIPAGTVTLEAGGSIGVGGKTFEVPAFSIAKYPVTNAQYAKFIAAHGYSERRWWTDEGWIEREKNTWTEPRHWQDAQWNQSDYPVVGVSWYETVAFCQWLGETAQEQVTLPSEQQWQRAAQGDNNRAYAWGNTFDKNCCNFNTQGTTAVMQYEGTGDSPFGVVDMTGNVWEWCLTAYESGTNYLTGADGCLLRGGSWHGSFSDGLRVSVRNWDAPDIRYGSIGFRCTRS